MSLIQSEVIEYPMISFAAGSLAPVHLRLYGLLYASIHTIHDTE